MVLSLGLLLIVTLLIFNWPKGADEEREGLQPTKSRSGLSVRKLDGSGSWEDLGYHGLDPLFHRLARRLEEDYQQWFRNTGQFHAPQIREEEWEKFARQRTAKLSVDEIASLLAWMDDDDLSYLKSTSRYHSAFFWNWGRKDALSAFRYFREDAEREDEAMMFKSSSGASTDIRSIWVFEGWAKMDAAAAWEFYSKIRESHEGDRFLDVNWAEVILREWTAQNAERAWDLIATKSSPDIQFGMIRGYLAGLPENQDWADVAFRVEAILGEKSLSQEIVSRWFLEDSDAALEWYQDNFSLSSESVDPFSGIEPNMSNQEIAAQFGITEQELWNRTKWDILRDIGMYQGRLGKVALFSWAKKNLPSEGAEGEFLLRGLIFNGESDEQNHQPWSDDVAWRLSPDHIDFFQLVGYLSPEVARRQLMLIVNLLPDIRGTRDIFEGGGWDFESSKMVKDTVKELAEEVPLSEEERAQAEVVFARLDEQERVLVEEWSREEKGSE